MGGLFASRALWERGPYRKYACGVGWNWKCTVCSKPRALPSPPSPCPLCLSRSRTQRRCPLMGGIQKPPKVEGISGAAQFLWLLSWCFCFSLHICMAQPLQPDSGMCLRTVSASSKRWLTSSHRGLSPPPRVAHSVNKLLTTFPTCHDGSLSALTASASAFLFPSSLQRDLGPAHLCASGHGIGH